MYTAAVYAALARSGAHCGAPDAERVCARFGVRVWNRPLAGRLLALYLDGNIAVRLGLCDEEREHLILHELGHHFLHPSPALGPALVRCCLRDGPVPALPSGAEDCAEYFAFLTALPGHELRALLSSGVPVPAIARRYRRTVAWVDRRIALS